MAAIPSLILTGLTERFSRLRFPTLFVLLSGLFLFDLLIPDFIPLVDELLLGIATLIVANLTRRRDGGEDEQPAVARSDIQRDDGHGEGDSREGP